MLVKFVLLHTTFGPLEVTFLSQGAFTISSYRNPAKLDKSIFLKDLTTMVDMTRLNSIENVLLVDDNIVKNLFESLS